MKSPAKRIEELEADLEEMTGFYAAAREKLAKTESELGMTTARCAALEMAVLCLSRLLTEARNNCLAHTKWKLS